MALIWKEMENLFVLHRDRLLKFILLIILIK
nr:MAG TPA: hypothetical protein [Caudoviricetes sp.]